MKVENVTRINLFFLFVFLSINYLQIEIPRLRSITYLIFVLSLFMFLILLFFEKKALLPSNDILIFLFLILIWKLIATSYSPFLTQAIKNILDFIFISLLSFFIIPNTINKENFVKLVHYTVLIICIFSIVGSNFIEPEEYFFRVHGTDISLRYTWLFKHPNSVGLHGLLLVLISIWIFEKRKSFIYLFSTLFGILISILADSRTSLIVIFIFILIYLLGKPKVFQKTSLKLLLLLYISITVLLLIWYFIDFLTWENMNRLLSTRLEIWKTLTQSMKNKLVGEGLFLPGENLVFSVDKNGFGLDGLFISVFYNEGIIGLSIFISFLILIMIKNYKKNNIFSFYFLVCALIYSFTESHFFINNLFTIFVLSMIAYDNNKAIKLKEFQISN